MYTKNVRFAIKNARYVVIFLILIIFSAVVMFKNKPAGFIPLEDEGRLYVTFELPEASSVTRTVEVMKKIMDVLSETEGIGHFSAVSGLNIVSGASKTNSGKATMTSIHLKKMSGPSWLLQTSELRSTGPSPFLM